jgi:hypothetical protein
VFQNILKAALVYESIGEKYFIEELKVKFKLETTNAYHKFIDFRNNKKDDIPLSFYSILQLSNQMHGSHLNLTVQTEICLLNTPFMDFTI